MWGPKIFLGTMGKYIQQIGKEFYSKVSSLMIIKFNIVFSALEVIFKNCFFNIIFQTLDSMFAGYWQIGKC